jgi:type IV secretion system protein VirD4
MRSTLKLFCNWGIKFEEPYEIEEKSHRKVAYADKRELEAEIIRRQAETIDYPDDYVIPGATAQSGMQHTPAKVRMPYSEAEQKEPMRTD